jgi:cytochrome c oxidase cbb3-type subunit III
MASTPAHSGRDTAMTGDEFDGIQQYDNPLPGWWTWLFVVTVVFSCLYFPFYHFGAPQRSMTDAYAREQSALAEKLFATLGKISPDEPTILRFANEPDWVSYGNSIYTNNCASCHGPLGGGLVGPNLTDNYYKNIKQVTDIARVIELGAANGAMPAWKNRLTDEDIIMMSSYVVYLRGKDGGPTAKRSEGDELPPWPAPPPKPAAPTTPENATNAAASTSS